MSKRTIHNVTCVWESNKKNADGRTISVKVESKDFNGWVPQSAVHDDSEVCRKGDTGKLVIKGWFAEQKGLELD